MNSALPRRTQRSVLRGSTLGVQPTPMLQIDSMWSVRSGKEEYPALAPFTISLINVYVTFVLVSERLTSLHPVYEAFCGNWNRP